MSKSEKRPPSALVILICVLLCLFTLLAVNFSVIQQEQSQLAIFVGLGLVLCFLTFPISRKLADVKAFKYLSWALALGSLICCGFIVVQMEPAFQSYWLPGRSYLETPEEERDADAPIPRKNLGNRAGDETTTDIVIAIIGLVLVLEATRRSIGWIVPALALAFIAQSYYCYGMREFDWSPLPSWMLPHAGQNLEEIGAKTFLQIGVFGPAAKVMFKFVFLFVIFGAFLELSGATKFIIDFSDRVFRSVTGGPAMVSVLGSALMGTLSGSAVANAVTTGSFTIPMMRKSGFQPHIAGGIMAAAAAGGALVPPVMGAGAYMMAELLQINFLTIAVAAMVPAALYYFSILSIVFLHARQIEERPSKAVGMTLSAMPRTLVTIGKEILLSFTRYEGIVFFAALATLIGLLVAGKTAFKAVSAAIVLILLLATFRRELNLTKAAKIFGVGTFLIASLVYQVVYGDDLAGASLSKAIDSVLSAAIYGALWMLTVCIVVPPVLEFFAKGIRSAGLSGWTKPLLEAFTKSAKNGVSLVAASACVGIIIGIVTSTGIAGKLSERIAVVVESNLLLALFGIMCCSLVLGMGVPSVVCYLLMATLMGPLLEQLGVTPLAAHLFIFYFGMMSMVTPPVALAAYASATIADAKIMQTAIAAFRFALVGFTLPYMFIYNPALLLLPQKGQAALSFLDVGWGVVVAMLGIVALAGGITGHLKAILNLPMRMLLFVAAALLLAPPHWYTYQEWHPLELKEIKSKYGAQFEKMKDGSLFVSGPFGPDGDDDYTLMATIADAPLERIAALRIEVLPDQRLPAGGSGRDSNGAFRLTELVVQGTFPDEDEPRPIQFDSKPNVDFAAKGEPARDILDNNPVTGWGVEPQVTEPHEVIFEATPEIVAKDLTLDIRLIQQFGDERTIGRFRVSVAERKKFGWLVNLAGALLFVVIVGLNFRRR